MTIRTELMELVSQAGITVPIAWPGVTFTPPNSGMWVEVRLFENEPLEPAMSNNADVFNRGILQLTPTGRTGVGAIMLDQLAEQIIAAFPKGTPIQGNTRVNRQPWKLGDVVEDDRVMIPVTIPYSG